ncbi:MAG: metal-dependent hydrolase [Acidobacteria bacterium]|nr:metal-dependent hydrolase [Acidobacteriota bacterium]
MNKSTTKKVLLVLLLGAPATLAPFIAGRANAPGQTRRARPITVAVIRPDGVIVPFAQFKDGGWSNPWPKGPDEPAAESRSLPDAPADWFAPGGAHAPLWHYRSRTSGAGRAVLHASAVVKVDNHCQTMWGLATDHPRAGSEEDCRGSLGVALDSEREIGLPVRLDQARGEWAALASHIRRRFERDEAKAAEALAGSAYAPWLPPREERIKTDPAIEEILCFELSGGRRLCSFAAERKYARPPSARDAGCESVSAFGGWLSQTGEGRPLLIEQGLALSDCERKFVGAVHPLGSLRIGGRREMPARFWLLSALCAVLPDADVAGLYFGVRYGDALGHRGLTHSLAFAFAAGVAVALIFFRGARASKGRGRWALAAYFAAVTASHGVLDALTDGGLGVAFFAPFDAGRHFLPWTPIRVSPIGADFFSGRGLAVLASEFVWVWLPSLALVAAVWAARKLLQPPAGASKLNVDGS